MKPTLSILIVCSLLALSSFAQNGPTQYASLIKSIEAKMDRLNLLILDKKQHESLTLRKLQDLEFSLNAAWHAFKGSRTRDNRPNGHQPPNLPPNYPPNRPIPNQPQVVTCPEFKVGSLVLAYVHGKQSFVTLDDISDNCFATGHTANQNVTLDLVKPQAKVLLATDIARGNLSEMIASQCDGVYVGQKIKVIINHRNRWVTVKKIAEDCTAEVSSRGQFFIMKLKDNK